MMEIHWRDYIITVNRYSWDLHKKYVMTQEKHDKMVKSGRKVTTKVGDYNLSDEGFFTSLDTLLQKMLRIETENMKGETTLSDYLVLWYDIVKNFTEQCEVIKRNLNANR